MLTPSQIAAFNAAEQNTAAELEQMIDAILLLGNLSFGLTRTRYKKADIDHVISKYQASGWHCQFNDGRLEFYIP